MTHLPILVLLSGVILFQIQKTGTLSKSPDNQRRKLLSFSQDIVDPTPRVLAEVVKKFGGSSDGQCHLLLYYDDETVTQNKLNTFLKELDEPISLLDVTYLKFELVTVKRGNSTLPVVELLLNRPEQYRCRILLSWSTTKFQKMLLILAKFQQGILNKRDTLVLSTVDKSLNKFIPELRNRVIVRREFSVNDKFWDVRLLVEKSCDNCLSVRLERFAEWHDHIGLIWQRDIGSNCFLCNKITVSYTQSVPNIFKIDNNTMDGIEFRMLEYAAEALNFSYILKEPLDHQWGKYANGTWTGKVGDVVYDRANLAIGGIFYQYDRSQVTSYSEMFHREQWGIVCQPAAKIPLWHYVMFPFRSDNASVVFIILVIMHALAFIIVSYLTTVNIKKHRERRKSLIFNFRKVLSVAASFYLRFLAFMYFWNLFYYILFPQYEISVDSAFELVNSRKPWGIVRGTIVESVLSKSMDSYHRKLAKYANGLDSIAQGLLNLENDGMCIVGVPKRFAHSIITTRYTTQCREPTLHVSTEDLYTVLGGWLMTRDSSFKGKVDQIIMRLQELGFLNKWRTDLYEALSAKREKLPCLRDKLRPLTLDNMRLVFFLILVGWGCSGIVFLLEHYANFVANKYPSQGFPNVCNSYDSGDENSPVTTPEHVMGVINQENKKRNVFLKHAMYRYRVAMLLKKVPALSIIDNNIKKQSITEMKAKSNSPTAISKNSHTEGSDNISTSSHKLALINQTNIDTRVPLSSDDEQLLSSYVTEVKPYETRLSRAIRLFPWKYLKELSPRTARTERLPQVPESPPSHLPPIKDPLNYYFGLKFRNDPIERVTLLEIANSSDSEGEQNANKKRKNKIKYPEKISFSITPTKKVESLTDVPDIELFMRPVIHPTDRVEALTDNSENVDNKVNGNDSIDDDVLFKRSERKSSAESGPHLSVNDILQRQLDPHRPAETPN